MIYTIDNGVINPHIRLVMPPYMMTMPQHFLLSAQARTLSLREIYRLSDDQAFETFKAIRFAENEGEAYCPECGCVKLYWISRCSSRSSRRNVSSPQMHGLSAHRLHELQEERG